MLFPPLNQDLFANTANKNLNGPCIWAQKVDKGPYKLGRGKLQKVFVKISV